MKINPEELVDTQEAAALIGLSNARGVSVYRRRYEDFPAPVIEKGACILWRRDEVAEWAEGRRLSS